MDEDDRMWISRAANRYEMLDVHLVAVCRCPLFAVGLIPSADVEVRAGVRDFLCRRGRGGVVRVGDFRLVDIRQHLD